MMRYITARAPGCNKAGRTRSSLRCNAHSTDSGQSVLSRHGILAHRSACFGRSGIRAHHVRPSGIDYIFSCVSVLFLPKQIYRAAKQADKHTYSQQNNRDRQGALDTRSKSKIQEEHNAG